MADSYKLTDLTTEIDLVYNASTQPYYTAVYGASVGTPEPRATWHQPDGYPAELVDLTDGNRTAYFEFHIRKPSSGDVDAVMEKMAALRRLVNQAARYSLNGDANRVYLKVQLDGVTNATLIPVVYGFVDDGAAWHNAPSRVNDIAFGAALMLTLEPYGQAETPITLKNYLLNPGFQAPSSGGVAAGWNIPGNGTGTVTESGHLLGTRRQNFTATGSGDLFQNAVNIVADATSAVAYIWCRILSGAGTWTLILYDVTATTDRATTTFSAANIATVADKTAKDTAGNTWYRIVVSSGDIINGNNHRLRVRAGAADAITLNAAYLQFGVTTPPPAWSSYHQLQNRADTSAANPERINHVDVWGVPGDAPALMRMKGSTSSEPEYAVHVWGMRSAGTYDPAGIPYFLDANDGTTFGPGGTWSIQSHSSASGGNYRRWTSNGGGSNTVFWNLVGDTVRALLKRPVRAFARVKSSDASGTFKLIAGAEGETKAATGYTDWWALDLGLINLTGVAMDEGPLPASYPALNIIIEVNAASGQTVDIDGVFLMPVEPLGITNMPTPPGALNWWLDGVQNSVVAWGYTNPHFGPIPQPLPGVLNRIYYIKHGGASTNGAWSFDLDAVVTELEITPRSRHLLGTV